MANELTAKMNSRRGYRAYVTRIVGTIDQLISEYNSRQEAGGVDAADDFTQTSQRIVDHLEQIELRWDNEDKVNGEISCLISEELLDNELAEQEAHKDERLIIRKKVETFVNGGISSSIIQVKRPPEFSSIRPCVVPAPLTHREPTLKPYDGDIYQWQSWWELFDANVHSLNIPTRIKFAELDKCLVGPAVKVIRGIPRTEQHYNTAIELLKEAYGDNKQQVEKLVDDLIDLTPVRDQHNVKGLRELLDGIVVNVRMLSNLGRDQSSYSEDLLRRLVAKMPREFAICWNETSSDSATVDDLIKFLTRKVKSREKCEFTHKPFAHSRSEPKPAKPQASTAATLVATVGSKPHLSCHFCKREHRAVDCDLSIEQRFEVAQRERRCHNCLAVGHRVNKCHPRNSSCHICAGRHHTSLCRRGKSWPTSRPEDITPTVQINCASLGRPPSDVFLQTATFRVKSHGGRWYVCLLDLGSQRTIVTRKVAEECGLSVVGEELVAYTGIGGDSEPPIRRKRYRLQICPTFPSSSTTDIEALEKDKITTATAAYPIPFTTQLIQRGLKLADRRFVVPGSGDLDIDLLIGADWYWKIVGDERRSAGGLVAMKSELGWVISGPSTQSVCGSSVKVACMLTRACQETLLEHSNPGDADLSTVVADLSAFFELEHIGIRDSDVSPKDIPLSERIGSFIEQTPCGRYQVPLPWNERKDQLLSNRHLAESRLRSLLVRLDRDRVLLTEYHRQMMEFVKLGWMSVVDADSKSSLDNYLPHLPVLRPDKATTKVRIVFDASAKNRGALCLNDCVEVGDNLYPDMLGIILRFGWFPVAWIGDVSKAFLQMLLRPSDRPACKVLWIEDTNHPLSSRIITLQWNRVAFGISCSPFLLAATIQKHLKKYEESDPKLVKMISKNTFVDDWTGGASSVEEALYLIKRGTSIFGDACMEIGRWVTNSPELKKMLDDRNDDDVSVGLSGVLMGCSKMLGLRWDTNSDHYFFDSSSLIRQAEGNFPLTKRRLLQIASKLFDPVGYISPVIITAKVIFQDLWKVQGLEWDSTVPENVRLKWNKFVENFRDLSLIKVPRYHFLGSSGRVVDLQLHVFGDASSSAFGAVAYFRITSENGAVCCRFVASKSRVAPVKSLTISRLELLAALTAARLGNYLKKTLGIEDHPTHFWTDSMVARYWIIGRLEKLLPWLRHRVEEIRSLSSIDSWRHCPGSSNPADAVSRGSSAAALSSNHLWWYGPSWLVESSDKWPSSSARELTPEEHLMVSQETKRVLVAVERVTRSQPVLDWNRYSSWFLLCKIVAWILRFRLRERPVITEVQPEDIDFVPVTSSQVRVRRIDSSEIASAELTVIRAAQMECYPEEFSELAAGERIHRGSSLVCLRPVFDLEHRLLRVTGRVDSSFEILGIRPPILIPKGHQVAKLLVEHLHRNLLHVGYKTVHAEILKSYWIVGGYGFVKRVISKCVICRQRHSRAFGEEVAPLPADRVRESLPFEVTGVDFAGPLYVLKTRSKNRNKPVRPVMKVWFLIFTCATTRAIFLDLVDDLTTETFILALRRFVAATNGTIATIYSDNAKTFHRTAKYLSSLWSNRSVIDYLRKQRITWKFSAPHAPWWGGFWERLVRSVKDLIVKTLRRSSVNRDQLYTLLKEIEKTVNNRPLTYVDAEELIPLTPALLINGFRPSRCPADPDTIEESSGCNLIRKERLRLNLLNRWRQRWRTEYCHDLRNFHYANKPGPRVRLGDVVLVSEDGVKRQMWRHGIVSALHRGQDGLCRAVSVRTSSGVITRPVQRLFPMELRADIETVIRPDQSRVSENSRPNEISPMGDDERPSRLPLGTTTSVPTGENVGVHEIRRMTTRGRVIIPPARFRDV